MQELGWPILEDRRIYSSQVLIYKMANRFALAYLQSLLPPRQEQHSSYHSRREHSFIAVRANTNKLYSSFIMFIPVAVRKWNSLETSLKSNCTKGSFKNTLRQSMFTRGVGYFSRCKGKVTVAHTRISLGLCPLRYQLFPYGIMTTPARCVKQATMKTLSLLPQVPNTCGQQTRSSPDTVSWYAQHQHKQHTNINKINNGRTHKNVIWRKCKRFYI